jgi:hypothetical protein
MFLYHAVQKSEIEKQKGPHAMEGNEMLAIEVIKTIKRLAKENGITLKKNPSIFLDKMTVEIMPADEINPELKQILNK